MGYGPHCVATAESQQDPDGKLVARCHHLADGFSSRAQGFLFVLKGP